MHAALDTSAWHAGMVSRKVFRALHGLAEDGLLAENDPMQNDWNESAKLARMLVAGSEAAWGVVMREGEALRPAWI